MFQFSPTVSGHYERKNRQAGCVRAVYFGQAEQPEMDIGIKVLAMLAPHCWCKEFPTGVKIQVENVTINGVKISNVFDNRCFTLFPGA